MEVPVLIGDMSLSSFPSFMPLVEASHLIAHLKGFSFYNFGSSFPLIALAKGFSFYNFGPSFPCVTSTFILSYMVEVFRTYELIVFLLHVKGTSQGPF